MTATEVRQMNVPDNYDAFLQHEAEQEALLSRRPKCVCCEEPIQDDYLYDINGDLYCEECMNEIFRGNSDVYER